jgi:hypothetical protein
MAIDDARQAAEAVEFR